MDIRYHGIRSIAIKIKDLGVLVGANLDEDKKNEYRVCIVKPGKNVTDFGSVAEGKLLIDGVGEYEAGGVEVTGIKYGKEGLMYVVVVDGYRVGVFFENGQVEEVVDKVVNLDILVILDKMEGSEKKLLALAEKTGVNFVILVGSKQDTKNLLDVFDREDIESVPKFSLKSGEELTEGMEVVLLSC